MKQSQFWRSPLLAGICLAIGYGVTQEGFQNNTPLKNKEIIILKKNKKFPGKKLDQISLELKKRQIIQQPLDFSSSTKKKFKQSSPEKIPETAYSETNSKPNETVHLVKEVGGDKQIKVVKKTNFQKAIATLNQPSSNLKRTTSYNVNQIDFSKNNGNSIFLTKKKSLDLESFKKAYQKL